MEVVMRAVLCTILLLVCACSERYLVSSNGLAALNATRAEHRGDFAVRAERVEDGVRVLVRGERVQFPHAAPSENFVEVPVHRPFLSPGIALLSIGTGTAAIGLGIFGAAGWDVNQVTGVGPVAAAGVGMMAVGFASMGVGIGLVIAGARGRPQEVARGRRRIEVGDWRVAQ
jgi:hypothetical protein